MVKNQINQKGWILQLDLVNLKTLYLTKKVLRHKMRRIQDKKHKMGTYKINKISLSCFDDKRLVVNYGFIHSLVFIKT